MAPMPPMGRERAMALVASGRLPLSFGSPHAFVMVLEQDGMFRIRELVVDPARSRSAVEDARRQGRPFTPEHLAALARPNGRIFFEATSVTELLERMRTMDWPANW